MPDSDFIAAAKRAGMPRAWGDSPPASAVPNAPDEAPEVMDCAALVAMIADNPHGEFNSERIEEQFRAQLIKLIDERIALAAQSAVRSGVAYRLHGEAPSGMEDPRK